MSRIGKQPVAIPGGVKVHIADGKIRVEGPKGKLEIELVRTTAAMMVCIFFMVCNLLFKRLDSCIRVTTSLSSVLGVRMLLLLQSVF